MAGLGGALVRGAFPSIMMILCYRSRAVVILSERAERARAKDLLVPVRRAQKADPSRLRRSG